MYQRFIFSQRSIWRSLLLAGISLLCLVHFSNAQAIHVVKSSKFGKLHELSLIDSTWYFHAGEFPQGRPVLQSTAGWGTLEHTDFGKPNAPLGWQGSGWFGMWFKLDTGLVNKKLSLRINHDGASEIFVDGKPVGGYGKVGTSAQNMKAIRALRELIPLWFNDTKPHLITIHYSNYFGVYPDFLGFQVWIGDYEARAKKIEQSSVLFSFLPVFAAAEIILGLLHLLLFLFYPRQKLNLYYALFVLFVGINGICVYLYYLTPFPSVQFFADLSTSLCRVLLLWSAVMLLYRLDYGRIPKWRLIALNSISLFYFALYIFEFVTFTDLPFKDPFSFVFFICIMDGLLSTIHLVKKRQKDVWLIVSGVIAVILVYFFAWSDTFGLWPYELNSVRLFVMSAGNLVLPFCLSLYLALDFARTNQSLTNKLVEVEDLSVKALAQEAEKNMLIAAEARRLEDLVQLRTAELNEKAERLREMDIVRSRFFTNITHEFKTPLTLIINPAKELLAEPKSSNSPEYLRLILNNAERLLQLINQLLDLSKLENGLMEFTPEPLDLVALIKAHSDAYRPMIIQKGIILQHVSSLEQLWIAGDRDKLDKIILNLLSNAIKFTDNGRVEIFLQQGMTSSGTYLSLTVRDTGQGIPAEKLPYIFTRFYQVDPSDTRSADGTGIGLAVVKELVELMGGTIDARSVEGLFTEINIRLPYQAVDAAEQLLPEVSSPVHLPAVSDDASSTLEDDGRPLIVLIEDHDDLRDFIHRSLATKYRVLSGANGEAGITLALENVPNLVITDLMMPGLDGYQVSAKLKKDERTSHIPIIILTAKADLDSKVKGIETGADAYLGKPFDKRELFAVIENLMSMREHLRELYGTNAPWSKDIVSLPSIEQDFMQRVSNAVEAHLNEEGYSADQLAIDLGLSRTQLHRKLKALIGKAPGEMIRIIRLQYAHDLLERRVATVAEVAYMVGFSSPASFSASFSRHFGFAPKMVTAI